MTGYPDGNPKTAQGAKKVPLHLVPPSTIHGLAEAFKDGADKYGPYNWREQMVSASVYIGAMKRHQDAWWDGEDLSPDALVHHLKHVMACCAIIIDAQSIGMLNDDRPPKGAAASLQQEYVARGAREARPIARGVNLADYLQQHPEFGAMHDYSGGGYVDPVGVCAPSHPISQADEE